MTVPATAPVPAAAPVPAGDLPGRLGIVIQRLAHAARARTMRSDLTPSRLAVLAILSSSGPLPVKDLAARAGIAVPTVSRAIELLVGFGWVERRAHLDDHRICLVAVSQAGCALLDAVRRDNTTRLAADIARLGPVDVAALEAALPVLETLAEDASG
jgi:DNA-binding MarR family transcriptional regulator